MWRDSTRASRRTVLKLAGAGILGSVGSTGIGAAHDPRRPNDKVVEMTWGSDGTDNWEFLEGPVNDPNEKAHRPLYAITPSGGNHSPHAPGHPPEFPLAHDHVIDTPGSGKAFTAEWHVHVVVRDASQPLSPANFNGVDIANPTVSKVRAAAAAGEVDIVDTADILGEPFVFNCPVRPHRDRGT